MYLCDRRERSCTCVLDVSGLVFALYVSGHIYIYMCVRRERSCMCVSRERSCICLLDVNGHVLVC